MMTHAEAGSKTRGGASATSRIIIGEKMYQIAEVRVDVINQAVVIIRFIGFVPGTILIAEQIKKYTEVSQKSMDRLNDALSEKINSGEATVELDRYGYLVTLRREKWQ